MNLDHFLSGIMKHTSDRISRMANNIVNTRFTDYDGYNFKNNMNMVNQIIDYESSENKNICDYSSDYCHYSKHIRLTYIKYKYWKQLSSWKSANYRLFRESRDEEEKNLESSRNPNRHS